MITTQNTIAPKQVQQQLIAALKLDPKNPRIHKPHQVRQIARSIETFGFNVPVLIDAQQNVVAGHGRIAAAQLLGMTDVPTISLEHLSANQARAFAIADNRLTENSSWDDKLLAEAFKDLEILNLDFTLDVTGFEMGAIDLMIEGIDKPAAADDADKLPPPSAVQISQPGDLWLMQKHRVFCGNSLADLSYRTLFQQQRASMIFTDPPYNVRIQDVTGNGTIKHREFAAASGEMTQPEFVAFLSKACAQMKAYSSDGALHFLFMDWRHAQEILSAGHAVYDELKNICIWAKDTAGMGSLYRSQHEMIFVWKSGKASHRNNIQLGKHGRHRSNVWRYPSPSSFGRTSEEGQLLALHPTVKPVQLVADAVLDCSARGDIVMDPFLGSGTTLIAAQRAGRRCFGLELDPLYVDTAIRRWQAFTGDKAVHAESGRCFDEIALELAHD